MKKGIVCLSMVVFSFFSLSVFAATSTDAHYMIVVDAGSSGSRLHLYQYTQVQKDSIPTITDVFSDKIKPGLASFADHPEQTTAYFQKLFNEANDKLKTLNINPSTVTVNVMATAGMRLLPAEKQQALYQAVTDGLMKNYTFKIGEVGTISGQAEGLYDWLDVNYLAKTFQEKKPTIGALDMGGASTEIAFVTDANLQSTDVLPVRVGTQTYSVFSKSFLGLGQDQAFASMQKDASASTCFPSGDPVSESITGQFNFEQCQMAYHEIIDKVQVASQIPDTKGQSFVAFSGFFYDMSFFHEEVSPDQNHFETQMNQACSLSWEAFQEAHPNEAPAYASAECANGIYVDTLLFNAYQLQGPQLTVTQTINNQSIDWPLGVVLSKASQ